METSDRSAPGWYPDPAKPTMMRWWDGERWGQSTVQAAQAPAAQPPGHTGRNAHLGRGAMLVWAVAQVLGAIVLAGAAIDATRSVAPTAEQQFDDMIGFFATTALFALLWMVSFVPLAVWNYRVATAAAALRMPATLSPALSVVGWVVPPINLVMPFLSVSDCLPPEHPARRRVLPWWIAVQVTANGYFPLFVLAMFSETAPLVTLAVLSAAAIAATILGLHLVEEIDDAHREAQCTDDDEDDDGDDEGHRLHGTV